MSATPDILCQSNGHHTKINIIDNNAEPSASETLLESKQVKRSLSERIPAFGIMCALISVLFFSLQSVCIKLISGMNSLQIIVIRGTFLFFVYGIAAVFKSYPVFGPKENIVWLMGRCVAGTTMYTTLFLGYKMLPIGDATTIFFASPIFVIFLAHLILKEPLNIVQVIACFTALIGVVFIAKPKFLFSNITDSDQTYAHQFDGIILVIIASLSGAIGQISLRKLKTTPAVISVLWLEISLIISGFVMLYFCDSVVWPTDAQTLSMVFLCCVCGVADQYFFTLAFQYENAGLISVTITLNIVLSFIWGIIILSEVVAWTSVFGACIVSSCVAILGLQKWKTENPDQFKTLFYKLDFGKK